MEWGKDHNWLSSMSILTVFSPDLNKFRAKRKSYTSFQLEEEWQTRLLLDSTRNYTYNPLPEQKAPAIHSFTAQIQNHNECYVLLGKKMKHRSHLLSLITRWSLLQPTQSRLPSAGLCTSLPEGFLQIRDSHLTDQSPQLVTFQS